jgi:signal transduction histidine kinase
MTSATHRTLGDPLVPSRLEFLSFSRLQFRSFVPVLGLIVLVAIAVAGYVTIRSLLRNERAVIDTDDAQKELQNLQLQRSLLNDYSSAYFVGREENAGSEFQATKQTALEALARLKDLSKGNPVQQVRLRQIEPLLVRDIAELEPPTGGKRQGNGIAPSREPVQIEMRSIDLQINQISAAMGGEEERLMSVRQSSLGRALLRNVVLLAFTVGASMLLLLSNIHGLRRKVRVGEQATEQSRERAESYRALSARILAAQDAERRKIGLELHDSVGQALTGVQMTLEQFVKRCKANEAGPILEALGLLQDSMREVRTLSQLLHPPLLDVAGFVAAARSYTEQFGRRSGIKVNINLPDDVKLPSKEAELMLFRVLQECLTNVHRHAHASSVNISFTRDKNRIVLTIHDNGKGLPPGVMESFNQGVALGVGLAGERERLAEFGGTLELDSSSSGTTVRASLPV